MLRWVCGCLLHIFSSAANCAQASQSLNPAHIAEHDSVDVVPHVGSRALQRVKHRYKTDIVLSGSLDQFRQAGLEGTRKDNNGSVRDLNRLVQPSQVVAL